MSRVVMFEKGTKGARSPHAGALARAREHAQLWRVPDTTAPIARRCRHCGSPVPAGVVFCSNCGASIEHQSATADPLLAKLRTLFDRQLEIERELGRGGMAVVYQAFDVALARRVAVKALLPEVAADPAMSARFIREARTVAALQHPHVVSIFGVRANEDISAIVMQYVEGRSLDVVLREKSPLPLPVAGLVLSQVAAGLQHAHERGIVHRDVKPANVLLDHEGRAVVSDFGLARQEGGTRLTQSGLVVGTLAYMSPEQRTGDEVGPAADQYALGVMAFEVLGGRLPFTGTIPDVNRAHLSVPAPRLGTARSNVPAAIEALVARMLEKEPAKRYPHLREAERLFRSLVPDERSTTVVLASFSHVVPTPSPEPRASATAPFALPDARVPVPESAQRGRSRRTLVYSAVGLLALIAAVLTWNATRTPPAVTPSANTVPSAGVTKAADSARGVTQDATANLRPPVQPAPAPAVPRGAPNPTATMKSAADSASAAARSAQGAGKAANSPPGAPPRDSAPPVKTPPKTDVAPAPVPALAAPKTPAATIADARALARGFVTMLNQRRWRDADQLGLVAGDTTLRREFIRLVRDVPDFAAGFDRTASTPDIVGDEFMTDCVLDLQWRGGQRLIEVQLLAKYRDGAWQLTAFRLVPG